MMPVPKPFPAQRTAVVTGCGSTAGIGRHVAQQLAASGYQVAALDINPAVAEFAAELAASSGQQVVGIVCDVSDEDSVAAAWQRIDAELPQVVGLANVAGIPCPVPLLELTVELFDRVFAINVRGTMLMMQYAAKRMVPAELGRIVNMSSIAAIDGGGVFSKIAYSSAKAAVIGLTRGGTLELGRYGITVNALCPGPIDTDIMDGPLDDTKRARLATNIPMGRIGRPEEVAAVVDFLLSEPAGYVNGTAFNVDGGLHMH